MLQALLRRRRRRIDRAPARISAIVKRIAHGRVNVHHGIVIECWGALANEPVRSG
jgi:hypothetical protein